MSFSVWPAAVGRSLRFCNEPRGRARSERPAPGDVRGARFAVTPFAAIALSLLALAAALQPVAAEARESLSALSQRFRDSSVFPDLDPTKGPKPTVGTIYYVDRNHPNASDANPGITENAPWATLDMAVDTVAPGDFVYIKGSTDPSSPDAVYDRSGRNGLNIVTPGEPDAPIVFRNYPGHRVIIQGDGSEDGLRLDYASHHHFYGLVIRNFGQSTENRFSPTDIIIENSEFTETTQTGLRLRNMTNLVLRDLYVHHCAESGISIRDGVNVLIERVESSYNIDPDDGDGIHTIGGENLRIVDAIVRYNDEDGFDLNANATMVNVVAENNRVVNMKLWRRPQDGYAEKVTTIVNGVFRNAGEAGIKLSDGAEMHIFNSVVYGNAEEGIAFRVPDVANQPAVTSEIVNTIIAGNGEGVDLRERNLLVSNNNLYFQNAGGDTAGFQPAPSSLVGLDPLFVASGGGDFRLRAASPAVDAGATLDLADAASDLNGDTRPQAAGFDIGVDERIPIVPGNRPAQLTGPAQTDYILDEGETLTVTFTGSDPDGDPFTFVPEGALPANMSIDPDSGVLTFKPDFYQGGNTANPSASYTVTAMAVDRFVTEPLSTRDIHITVGNVNQAPEHTGLEKYTLVRNRPFMMRLNARDIDGDGFSYAVDGLPAGIAFNAETAELIGTPVDLGVTDITLTLTETTATGLQSQQIVAFEVLPETPGAPNPPLRTVSVSTNAELNAALDDARPGDLLLLNAGVYPGPHNIEVSGTEANPIVIAAAPGANVVFDGAGFSSPEAFNFKSNASHIVLDGLTIQNEGESLYFRGNGHENITIANSTISDGDYGIRGGSINGFRLENVAITNAGDRGIELSNLRNAHIRNVSVTVIKPGGDRGISLNGGGDNVQILDVAVSGGKELDLLYAGTSLHLRNARLRDSETGVWMLARSSGFIINTLAYDFVDEGDRGRGLKVSPDAWLVVENSTVTGSEAYGVTFSNLAYLRFRNNVVAGHGRFAVIVEGGLPPATVEENNLFLGKLLRFRPGPLSIIADPLFRDPAAKDFRPQPGSPLVNAGQAIDYIDEDLDGTSRPLGGLWDIGAYEVN